MVFNSFTFAAFFASVFVLYLIFGRRLMLRNALLLLASYVFYGWWDWRFLSLIVISTIADYVCALVIQMHSVAEDSSLSASRGSTRIRRMAVWTSVGVNLSILGFFKYFDFFAVSTSQLLAAIGLPLQPRLLNIVLPVGISFYTFQTMSYTIDVYYRRMNAQRNLLNFATYVAFFPQLVAGPICRARDLLPQIAAPTKLGMAGFNTGSYLVLWGLFKKIVIADNLAILVDSVFADPSQFNGGAVLVAVYAFAIQIYCDFSGYTDVARGIARMLGFDLQLNFNLPYFATNPQNFWRRWHISLSTWLRDYLYVPLGGSRRGTRRTCINLMLTMILGGLWHGAAWTFVLWGLFHGLLLVTHRALKPYLERRFLTMGSKGQFVARVVTLVGFFHVTCVGWLIFRAESIPQIWQMLGLIFTPWPWWIVAGANSVLGTGLLTLVALALPLMAMQIMQHRQRDLLILLKSPAPVRGFLYALMIYSMVIFGDVDGKPFIYFQF
ncbi:MAG: MBOAT family O-acyltransferase [Planctomycetota bacterium]|jgi:D-alanyl-lipoteichoic acid acyltransferase DltB (MBOAT superfamily)